MTYKGRVADALPLPIERRVSCDALRSNSCTNDMKSVARVADALHLPKGTAFMRDADALHLPVTLKGTVTQNDVLRTPMNDVMSASPVSCVSSSGKGLINRCTKRFHNKQLRVIQISILVCLLQGHHNVCMARGS